MLDRHEEDRAPRHHVPLALAFQSRLDPSLLDECVEAVVQRHEALRSTFGESGGKVWRFVARDSGLTVHHKSAEALSEHALRAEIHGPFDLGRGPLVRLTSVWDPSLSRHVVVCVAHHIAFDGWSSYVFFRDLLTLYHFRAEGRGEGLMPITESYSSYLSTQRKFRRTKRGKRHLKHWLRLLSEHDGTLAIPLIAERGDFDSYRSAQTPLSIDAPTTERLRIRCVEASTSLHSALLAAFVISLAATAEQRHFLIAVPTSGRSRGSLQPLIGCFSGFLYLPISVKPDESFTELAQSVQRTVLVNQRHFDVRPEEALRMLRPGLRPRRTPPICEAVFSFQAGRNFLLPAARTATVSAPPFGHPQRFVLPPKGADADARAYDGELLYCVPEDMGSHIAGGFDFNRLAIHSSVVQDIAERFCAVVNLVADGPNRAVRTILKDCSR